MKGQVLWFNDCKGFGFIKGDDERSYFCHRSNCKDKCISKNDDVEFNIINHKKGFCAVDVVVL